MTIIDVALYKWRMLNDRRRRIILGSILIVIVIIVAGIFVARYYSSDSSGGGGGDGDNGSNKNQVQSNRAPSLQSSLEADNNMRNKIPSGDDLDD